MKKVVITLDREVIVKLFDKNKDSIDSKVTSRLSMEDVEYFIVFNDEDAVEFAEAEGLDFDAEGYTRMYTADETRTFGNSQMTVSVW